MKHLLLLIALLLATSSFADTPAKITADYRKQAAKALEKVNDTLEKATVPLIAELVKAGNIHAADTLREQLHTKLLGDPVPQPQPSADLLFKSYDVARLKALESVQKTAISRIDAMLVGSEGKKLETVAALAQVREEIELSKLVAAAATMPEVWTYHVVEKSDGATYGEMHFLPDGSLKMLDRGAGKKTRQGHWKSNKKGDKVSIYIDGLDAEWRMEIKDATATLDRPDVGRRYMRVKAPKA